MRILHVEYDSAVTKSVELMLNGVADSYEPAMLGENAVKMASRNIYDVILLDMMLRDIDGVEVVRRLRAGGVQTPILVLSGLVNGNGAFDVTAMGAVEALAKPFTKERLIDSIRSVMAKSGLTYPGEAASPVDSAEKPWPADKERRRHRRFKADQPALISQGPGIECRLVDLSYGGAGLQLLADHFDLQSSFQLVLQDKSRYTCRVCWRQSRRLGVKFLGRGG